MSAASAGTLLFRPLLVGGAFFFCARLAVDVRGACRRLLTRFGEVVLEVGPA